MKILIDNGHGSNTPGKRSPDGTLKEYAYTREISKLLVSRLKELGYDAELVTPETWDVSLTSRVKRINSICKSLGASNVLVISIHNNAAGADGKWHSATGWQVHVSLNASKNSKRLASCLVKAAEEIKLKVRKPLPTQDYWPQNLAICRDTNCPAVLTENMFQDNKEDVAFLLSDKGKEAIVELHIKGIIGYIKP